MKKSISVLILLLISSGTFAQDNERISQREIDDLKSQISDLRVSLDSLYLYNQKILGNYNLLTNSQSKLTRQYNRISQQLINIQTETNTLIDSLEQRLERSDIFTGQKIDKLDERFTDSQESTNQSILQLSDTQSRSILYWAVSILVVILIIILVYIFLKKYTSERSDKLESNLIETRKNLEEESVKLDIKLMELLDKQMQLVKETRSDASSQHETDHSLVLKIADRLISMEKNLSRMNKETKGLKQLLKAVKNIKDNFAANGYEIVEMVGKPYNEGMKVTANFIPDDTLQKGEQIITRIIKPQVNYKGVMIQSAQIEVSLGE